MNPKSYQNLVWKYANFGTQPDDSDSDRVKKAILTIISTVIAVLAVLWGSVYVATGYQLAGLIPLAYSIISFFSIYYFFKTKRFGFFRFSQLLLILLLPFFLQASLGGFANGSVVMVWGFFTPLAAMFFSNLKTALGWLLAFLVLIVISGIFDSELSQKVDPLPEHVNTLYFMMNMGGALLLIYIVLHYFVRDRERSYSLLERSREEAIDARDELEKAYSQLQKKEAKIRELMLTDPLTELANRRHLDDRLADEIERSDRYGHKLAVIIADLDHFKSFNDEYGHLKGDDALKLFADVMVNNVRAVDFVARYGGEEFVIVMPETTADGATRLAERIRQSMAQREINGVSRKITSSFGVTMKRPGDEANDLVARADKALYQSKENGRNRVTFME
ncbi:MAG: GGDEF domain-containing protein [Gammaproteobacteria bacterium]|jgi:diguanylate cyclase (GGDEF)-like protein